MLTLEDFKKVELRIAKVIEAKDHPDAQRLLVLTIDLGDKTKQIVAGIKSSYQAQDLLGRQVVVVDNLEPALLRGVESQGMLLACQDEQGICIIQPQREVRLGTPVK